MKWDTFPAYLPARYGEVRISHIYMLMGNNGYQYGMRDGKAIYLFYTFLRYFHNALTHASNPTHIAVAPQTATGIMNSLAPES